jgi:hypothetical protein
MAKTRHRHQCDLDFAGRTVITDSSISVAGDVNIDNSDNSLVQHIDNSVNTTIINNIDNSTTTINVTLLSFGCENMELVKKYIRENPEQFKSKISDGNVDEILWLATHKMVPVNDNIVKQVKGRSYLQVVVGGKVVERSTELAYRTMIDNNDKLIASKVAPEIKPRDVMKPHLFGQKKAFTPEQNYKFRTRKLKDLVVDKLEPRMCPTKNPFLTVPSATDIHAGPDLDLAYELAKKYLPLQDSGIEEYAAICAPICKYAGVYFNGAWWKTGELSGVTMQIVSETTKNYIYEKMADLIMMFLEKLLQNPGFDTQTMERSLDQVVRYDMEVSHICHYILKSMEDQQ